MLSVLGLGYEEMLKKENVKSDRKRRRKRQLQSY